MAFSGYPLDSSAESFAINVGALSESSLSMSPSTTETSVLSREINTSLSMSPDLTETVKIFSGYPQDSTPASFTIHVPPEITPSMSISSEVLADIVASRELNSSMAMSSAVDKQLADLQELNLSLAMSSQTLADANLTEPVNSNMAMSATTVGNVTGKAVNSDMSMSSDTPYVYVPGGETDDPQKDNPQMFISEINESTILISEMKRSSIKD